MNARRIPVIPTVLVVAAAAIMVALGFWQLGRKDEKEALIARYESAIATPDPVSFPVAGNGESVLFRQSRVDCERVLAIESKAGRSASGRSGWLQRATCATGDGDAEVLVDIGWTDRPQASDWNGGEVTGVIASGPRLVATQAASPELEPLATPDPADLPNNHLAYAGQWFFFAITALVIYWLALRRRWRDSA